MSNTSDGSVGFTSILVLIFITLKLTGYIQWSWWWVLSPIWISILLAIIVVLIAVFLNKPKN